MCNRGVALNGALKEFPTSEDRIERETLIEASLEKVEPPTCLAYRWTSAFPGEELREDNSTLVEFMLTREGDRTRLRVVESGFTALAGSEELRSQNHKGHSEGWPLELDALRSRAEAPSM